MSQYKLYFLHNLLTNPHQMFFLNNITNTNVWLPNEFHSSNVQNKIATGPQK